MSYIKVRYGSVSDRSVTLLSRCVSQRPPRSLTGQEETVCNLRCFPENDRSLWPTRVAQRSSGKGCQLMVANQPEAGPALLFAAFTPSIYPSWKGDQPMSASSDDLLKQVDQHLSHSNQAWLLGAGVSCDAGLPLMASLTKQVLKLAEGQAHEQILKDLQSELPDSAHIEHMLSQLGDYTAIANRVQLRSVNVERHTYFVDDLDAAHKARVLPRFHGRLG